LPGADARSCHSLCRRRSGKPSVCSLTSAERVR
jgi:hypothetical protein